MARNRTTEDVTIVPANGDVKEKIGTDAAKKALETDRRNRVAQAESEIKQLLERHRVGLQPVTILRPGVAIETQIHVVALE